MDKSDAHLHHWHGMCVWIWISASWYFCFDDKMRFLMKISSFFCPSDLNTVCGFNGYVIFVFKVVLCCDDIGDQFYELFFFLNCSISFLNIFFFAFFGVLNTFIIWNENSIPTIKNTPMHKRTSYWVRFFRCEIVFCL